MLRLGAEAISKAMVIGKHVHHQGRTVYSLRHSPEHDSSNTKQKAVRVIQ